MRLFNLHTHRESDDPNVVALSNRYPKDPAPKGFYSIGIHPWYIDEPNLDREIDAVRNALSDNNCIAIGECGLDKRIDPPLSLQERVFRLQVGIAVEFQKPLVLHCVAAYQEAIAIKKEMNVDVPMIIHGFSKSPETAKQLLDHGFYLSFGKYLLRNPELRETFLCVPDDRFFLETDSMEEGIDEVYARAAEYRNTDQQAIAATVSRNVKRVFNIEI